MFYRLTLNLNFTDYDPLNDLMEELRRRFLAAITINPGSDQEEKSYYLLQECYHDESPATPCRQLEADTT